MINLDEIRKISAQVSLSNTVVEKDYALGWLLWGIQKHPLTKKSLVFKGGTCLKKCYFDTFRFSEDLDFSYLGIDALNTSDLTKIFKNIAKLIYEESGLEIPEKSIQFEIFSNSRGSESIQGSVKFRGPVRPQVGLNQMQRIKIDITLDEPLVLSSILKPVEHGYSDYPVGGISASSYTYEEMFAEKVRALAQRLRPRDLYDVVHLYRRMDLNKNRNLILSTLESKCALRKIELPTIENLQNHDNRQFLETEWEQQLKHQMPVLPSFKSFLDELPDVLLWLTCGIDTSSSRQLACIFGNARNIKHISVFDETISGIHKLTFNRIRMAASNRLLVRFIYDQIIYHVECYSFGQNPDGLLILGTKITEKDGLVMFHFEKIQKLEVKNESFFPQFKINIGSSTTVPVYQLGTDN